MNLSASENFIKYSLFGFSFLFVVSQSRRFLFTLEFFVCAKLQIDMGR